MESRSPGIEPNSMSKEADNSYVELQILSTDICHTNKERGIPCVETLSLGIEPNPLNMECDTAYVKSQSLRMELSLTSINSDIPYLKVQAWNTALM